MGEKKQLIVNMAAAIVSFIIQAGINFVLTPFITAELGAEAYGFVTLSTTLVNYIAVITVAITSMTSRFISIEVFRGNQSEANKYYSSTLASLVLCVLLFAIPSLICISMIDRLLQISPGLVGDVQLLMIFILGGFSLTLMTTNFSIGFYVKNKLYIASAINAAGFLVRACAMLVMFIVLPTSVSIVGISTFISISLVQFTYLRCKRKLLPEIQFRKQDVSLGHIATVIKAGIWNSVSQLGSVLSIGLDMIICNLFLGGAVMGMLSISRVVRQAIDSISSALISTFQPTLTRYYAADDIDGLVAYAKWAMKAFGLVIALPVGGFIAFGVDFFKLWVPGQDTAMLFSLAFIAIISWTILAPAAIIHNIFTVINRIRTDSLLICIGGFCIVVVECFLLYATDYGVMIIAATSCLETVVRNLVYTVPAGARYLGKPWWTFFPCVGQSFLCTAVVVVCGLVVRCMYMPVSWPSLILEGLLSVCIGALICLAVMFGKSERRRLRRLIQQKLH